MAKAKNVLTTGDVARICNVAPRTVSKWFDNGQLKGYRIPGSNDRRIPHSELIRFMKEFNIPVTPKAAGKIRVLIVETKPQLKSSLTSKIAEKGRYETETALTDVQTGLSARKLMPHVILIDLMADDIHADDICRSIREDEDLQAAKIIAVVSDLSDPECDALLKKGYDDCVKKTDSVTSIIRKIEQATSLVF